MKKHNFEQAISIFKGMFEGWSVVTEAGERLPVTGIDTCDELTEVGIFSQSGFNSKEHISHLEQTLPMNGDEVWAWDDGCVKQKFKYIGRVVIGGRNAVQDANGFLYKFENVELISPTRRLTISEATDLLKGVVNEPFEIVK